MQKLINKQNIFIATILLVVLQPILDLDYLIYPFLDKYGLPRISTVINYVIIPIMVLLVFKFYTQDKKKTFILWGSYGIILAIYFYIHNHNSIAIFDKLILPSNYYYNAFQELSYFVTMIIPLVYIWMMSEIKISSQIVKKITLWLSGLTAIPIFLGDVFVFGKSTYSGYTSASIFTWFSGIYEEYLPRTMASKFFFSEGNTIGILMMMLLPLLYYYFYQEKNKKAKISLFVLIVIHSLAMIMLGTRVGTYGSFLVPIVVLIVYLFLIIIKKEQFQKVFIASLIVIGAVAALIFPYSPARQNQLIDSANDYLTLQDNYILEQNKDGVDNGEQLVPGSFEYNQFYIYYFVDNCFLINATPKEYYEEYYYYQFDPKFWVDYIFNYSFEERVNGRQTEMIFFQYKWQNLSNFEKLWGFSYSTFMNGSIVLEKDFVQQFFTFGYVGFTIMVLPWLVMLAYLVFKVLSSPKRYWNFETIMIMFSICIGVLTGYISGHVLDQFITSLFMATLFAAMFLKVKKAHEE